METPDSFVIQPEEQGERLDKVMARRDPATSRSQWQKRIKAGEVLVNNKKQAPHYELKNGETVTVQKTKKEETPPLPLPNIPLIAETDDYLVIDKPAGVLVHPAPGAKKGPLLTDWLKEHYPFITEVGDDPLRPGIVHRLDREVSGVMVVAKTNPAFAHLRTQFKEHHTQKTYTALVHGALAQDSGKIHFPIGRSDEGRMVARPHNDNGNYEQEGKEAHTHYEVLKRYTNYTLLAVEPVTGRTHQIRVHLFALGHPVVGDTLYAFKGRLGKNQPQPPRLMLHATRLCFRDVENQEACFEAPLPEEFEKFIHKLQ